MPSVTLLPEGFRQVAPHQWVSLSAVTRISDLPLDGHQERLQSLAYGTSPSFRATESDAALIQEVL